MWPRSVVLCLSGIGLLHPIPVWLASRAGWWTLESMDYLIMVAISLYGAIWVSRSMTRYRYLVTGVERHLKRFIEPGQTRFRRSSVVASISCLDELSMREPDKLNWPFLQGKAWQMLGDYDKALPFFERALEHDPGHGDLINETAVVLIELSRLDEAEEMLRRGIKANPAHQALLGNQVVLATLHGPIKKALSYGRRFEERFPKDPRNQTILLLVEEILAGKRQRPASYAALRAQPKPVATSSK